MIGFVNIYIFIYILIDTMKKYKNKEGIELSYKNKDVHTILVKEVISEAIKLLTTYNRNSKISMNMAISNTKEFLKTNFDLENNNDTR